MVHLVITTNIMYTVYQHDQDTDDNLQTTGSISHLSHIMAEKGIINTSLVHCIHAGSIVFINYHIALEIGIWQFICITT